MKRTQHKVHHIRYARSSYSGEHFRVGIVRVNGRARLVFDSKAGWLSASPGQFEPHDELQAMLDDMDDHITKESSRRTKRAQSGTPG